MSELVDQIAKLEAKANQLKDSVSVFGIVATMIQWIRIGRTLMFWSAKHDLGGFESFC